MWAKVNKALLPMKGHYFLFSAGTAPVQPFMPVYAKNLGFSSVVVGTIYSILPVTGMLAKPFFGAIADRFRLHKFFFLFFQVLTIVAFFSIQFIPEIPHENDFEVNLVCGAQTNFHVNISDIRGTCAVKRMLAAAKSNETIKCTMKCILTPEFQNEICHPWKAKIPLCVNESIISHVDNIIPKYGDKDSKKSKLIDIGKDAYVEKFRLLPTSASALKLNITVPMKHTVLETDLIYFRVTKVVLDQENSSHNPYCLQLIDTSCNITCEDSMLTELLNAKKERNDSTTFVELYQFWLLLIFLIGSWIGMAVVSSISDAICFELLGIKASLYGNQRLWGSVGWGIFALLSGLIIDEFSKGQSKKNYTPVFYIMLVMLLSDIACSFILKYQQTKLSSQILKNVGKLLNNIKVDIFLLWCIFIGICIGIQWNFLFWYVEELTTAANCEAAIWMKTLQGLLSIIQCFLGELPSFFVSGWILKKFGHTHVMSGILFVTGIRFILYSFLINPWWCLPIEILQATVGLSFATMASYASMVAPPGTEATVQGLVGAVFEGIGVSLGALLGGFFFYNYNGSFCFRFFGIASLLACAIHIAVQYLLNRTTVFRLEGKDFDGSAKYASPTEAVSMLEDT